jgi:hypothetical protein
MRSLFVVGAVALSLVACKSSVDPDTARFSCTSSVDCGAGYECRPQFAPTGALPGRCFKVGQCKDTETCDGADENCDGRVDESFPEQDGGCTTTVPGLCAAGVKVCQGGAIGCAQTIFPVVELCNGLDDNCNGRVDEAFDLTTDNAHCGSCSHACASGTTCHASTCLETACNDGLDNDQNGRTDCADEACFGLECALTPPPSGKCGVVALQPDAGADDAGATDAGSTDAGSTDAGFVRGCFRAETTCDNGLDDDGDGLVDCLDPDCNGLTCFSGTICANRACPGPG